MRRTQGRNAWRVLAPAWLLLSRAGDQDPRRRENSIISGMLDSRCRMSDPGSPVHRPGGMPPTRRPLRPIPPPPSTGAGSPAAVRVRRATDRATTAARLRGGSRAGPTADVPRARGSDGRSFQPRPKRDESGEPGGGNREKAFPWGGRGLKRPYRAGPPPFGTHAEPAGERSDPVRRHHTRSPGGPVSGWRPNAGSVLTPWQWAGWNRATRRRASIGWRNGRDPCPTRAAA